MQDTNPLQWALLQPLIGKVFLRVMTLSPFMAFVAQTLKISILFKERIPDAEYLHWLSIIARLKKS